MENGWRESIDQTGRNKRWEIGIVSCGGVRGYVTVGLRTIITEGSFWLSF